MYVEKSGIKSGNSKGIKGGIDRFLAKNISFFITVAGRRLKKKYDKAAKNLESAQLEVLRDITSHAKDTVFGKENNFGNINTYNEYKKSVKVVDYEDIRPYVMRHVNGEKDVLFKGHPLLFTRTSGTTAEPKLIPITHLNFEKTIKNRGKLWLYGLLEQFKGIFDGKDLTLVSPAVDGYTDSNIPYGALSGLIYSNIPEFVKQVHSVPYEVILIKDFSARAYALLRLGVPSNITGIYTGNPATVLNLVKKADLWKFKIIEDVKNGTLDSEFDIEPEIRKKIESLLSPAPKRAAELKKIADGSAIFKPFLYWPNLKLIHTWTNGNCNLVLPQLKEWFGSDVPILDFGYIASEITATDLVDATNNGSKLAVLSAFYEFSKFEEGNEPSEFYMAHQLQSGKRYYIYVTTYSGLYRYNMNDVIEVIDFYYQVPVIRFLFKGDGITSLQGEKLSEKQFINSVTQTAENRGVEIGFFAGYADKKNDRYTLYIEFKDDLSKIDIDKFAQVTDLMLQQNNIEYESKRKSERLNLPVVIPLVNDAFEMFRNIRLEEGAFEGQFKWIQLFSDDLIKDKIEKLVL